MRIEIDPNALKELKKMDTSIRRRILNFLKEKVEKAEDPRSKETAWENSGDIESAITASSAK